MRFADITGHKEQINRLISMADREKLPHAILLHGPAGIGKMAVARAFSQYLFCTDKKNGDSCGKCPACLQTSKLNNPDIHFIYPVLKKSNPPRSLSADYMDEWKEYIDLYPYMPEEQWLEFIEAGTQSPMIYVAESEEILRLSSLSAYGDGYKIFIIWQPEKINTEASNKLLKVIEEPHEDTLFILVSNNAGALMPTIRSRLQGIEFQILHEDEIAAKIMESGLPESEARNLARIAKGNINTALAMARTDGESAQFTQAFIGVMRAAYARKMVELKNYSDKFASFGREKSIRLLNYFARMVRESFISNLRCEPLESMTAPEKQFVAKFGPFINAANVEAISKEIDRAREDISRNANQKIVWFDFFIELARLIRTNIPK